MTNATATASAANEERPPQAVAAGELRAAMRQLAGGVCVITVGDGNNRTGLTATSLVPVGLEPPEILITVNQQSSSFPILLAERRFAVNLLAHHQQHVAERFAGKDGVRGVDRYEGAAWQRSERGLWLLKNCLVALECEVEYIGLHRTHALVVARVQAIAPGEHQQTPLLYWQGGFRRLAGPLPN